MSQAQRGVALGSVAYVLWGMSALYWPLLKPTGAVEILMLRILWSPLAIVALLTLTHRWHRVRTLIRRPRQLQILAVGAVLTSLNWGLFIFATTHGHVVDASLGYFITPLVSVCFGVTIFHERLRPAQWIAVVLAAVAMIALSVDYGSVPWIAIGLALTFGTYGLIKKHINAGALEGLMVETVTLLPVAVIYTAFAQATGRATFGHVSIMNTCLGIGAGVVMMAPMLLFSAAATRIPLSLTGMLQFIEPVVQFLIGFVIFHESMPPARWSGFALVWGALALLVADGVRAARTNVVQDPTPL